MVHFVVTPASWIAASTKDASVAAWIIKGFLVKQLKVTEGPATVHLISALASREDAPRISTASIMPTQELGAGTPAITALFARGKHRASVVVASDMWFFMVLSSKKTVILDG